jgi:hypothetical protein
MKASYTMEEVLSKKQGFIMILPSVLILKRVDFSPFSLSVSYETASLSLFLDMAPFYLLILWT